jgi:hypothetical protein
MWLNNLPRECQEFSSDNRVFSLINCYGKAGYVEKLETLQNVSVSTNNAANIESVQRFLKNKFKNCERSTNPISGYIFKSIDLRTLKWCLLYHVHHGIIHNSQDSKIT